MKAVLERAKTQTILGQSENRREREVFYVVTTGTKHSSVVKTWGVKEQFLALVGDKEGL